MKKRAFALWIAVLLLVAAVGLWAVADGARRYQTRPLVNDFVRIFSQEEAQ